MRSDESIPTRASLLNRLKDWTDHESWSEFFETYWRLIYNVAIRAGLSDAEAQDVVQETIISVAKQMPDFNYSPAIGSFRGFLLKTTRWRIADQFRKRASEVSNSRVPRGEERETPALERIPDASGLSFEEIWKEEWERNLSEAALERVKRRVNPKHYQLFDLLVQKQWSVEEITSIMGVTKHQVYAAKSRIAALLKKERECLESKAR